MEGCRDATHPGGRKNERSAGRRAGPVSVCCAAGLKTLEKSKTTAPPAKMDKTHILEM